MGHGDSAEGRGQWDEGVMARAVLTEPSQAQGPSDSRPASVAGGDGAPLLWRRRWGEAGHLFILIAPWLPVSTTLGLSFLFLPWCDPMSCRLST